MTYKRRKAGLLVLLCWTIFLAGFCIILNRLSMKGEKKRLFTSVQVVEESYTDKLLPDGTAVTVVSGEREHECLYFWGIEWDGKAAHSVPILLISAAAAASEIGAAVWFGRRKDSDDDKK